MKLAIKIIGLLLLLLGVAIILYTIYNSYQIFTAKTAAPEIFKQFAVKLNGNQNDTGLDLGGNLDINKIIGSQVEQLLPTGSVTDILNLVSWSILAGIMIFGGGQVGILGIKLLKD